MAAVHHAFHRRMARCRIALPALVDNNESASPSFTRNLFGLHPAMARRCTTVRRVIVRAPIIGSAKQKPGRPFGLTDLGFTRDRH